MLNKAFGIIESNVQSALESKEFNKVAGGNKFESFFENSALSYKLVFNEKNSCFEFSVCTLDEDGNKSDYKMLSTWLFDKSSGTQKEAESIANDFAMIINGSRNKAKIKASKPKKKGEDRKVDSIFFINRLAGLFPELKDKIKEEKENHEKFRNLHFIKENVTELIKEALSKPNKGNKKLYDLLSDMYKFGDLDVKSIITIVILNSIEEPKAVELLQKNLSKELNKAWESAQKFKGKKVKPEKKKKVKKGFLAQTLQQK